VADRHTDRLYAGLRQKFGQQGTGANGYQLGSFFRREQALLYSLLQPAAFPLVDIACGSGLMLAPFPDDGARVIGLDFNQQACLDAHNNGLAVLRGDAFELPFADQSIAQLVNCQFLNQQDSAGTQRFIGEAARVLKPGGRIVLFWRHADSLFHWLAGALVHTGEWLRGAPRFPQFSHSMDELEVLITGVGLTIVERMVTVPFLYSGQLKVHSLAARVVGASLVVVAEKPVELGGRNE